VGPMTEELCLAVAYATSGGCKTLIPRLIHRIGHERWSSIPRTVIVTTDFHITEPSALAYMRSREISVRLSRLKGSNFHPKLYASVSKDAVDALVGSPNLTLAALTDNVEAATVSQLSDRRHFGRSWQELLSNSVELTDKLLERYERERRRKPPHVRPDREPTPITRLPANNLTTFPKAVEAGLQPANFSAMWVEVGKPSGGSDNQLEPPRGTHLFFGLGGGGGAHLIGRPVLVSGGREWKDCDLTWHGQEKMNQMTRFNLPTLQQGGFSYVKSTVLFMREGSRYRLIVAQPGDPIVRTWQRAAREVGHEYQLGKGSPRRCGLF
jgi:HKD family nuclease